VTRLRYGRNSARAKQRAYRAKMVQLKASRKVPSLAIAAPVVPKIEAQTVFVWPRMGLRCGIAEYVKHLVEVSAGAKYCRKTGEIKAAGHVVLVLMPSLNEPIPSLVSFIQRVRRSGGRVTLDVHHMTVGQRPFTAIIKEANDTVWRHPRMPALAGSGRYVPLPVPSLPPRDTSQMSGDSLMRGHLGGLTHFGLGHVSKRIPIMARVAQALETRLYIYGDRNRDFVPPDLATYVAAEDTYPSEAELARLLRQHDVGLIGRARWSSEVQLNGSASARFFAGVGLPTVLDRAAAHEDLVDVFDVVSFDDFAQVVARTRLLVENTDYRAEALEKLERYAEVASPRRVAEQMNITVKR
jgi:hypothetical protein